MKKSTLLLIAVLLVVFNAAAWKELRADEVRNTEGYELAMCYQAFGYAQLHMVKTATYDQLAGYFLGRKKVQEKQSVYHVEEHKMYVSFAKRDFRSLDTGSRKELANACVETHMAK